MRKLFLSLFVIGATISSAANADEVKHIKQERDVGVVTQVNPIYKERTYQVPTQSCDVVEIPVYGNVYVESNTGDKIAGAIIGGVIGHQFGNGNGKDAMTALGAIVGSNVAGQGRTGRTIVGYRQERVCKTVYVTERESFISSYEVTFKYKDSYSTFNTTSRYAVGDSIEVRVMMVPVYK